MKYNNLFNKLINCKNENDVFEYLINNLKNTIISWDFFVAWEKVINNVKDVEDSLNLLNYLVGQENIAGKFKELVLKHPEVVDVLPLLIAWRPKNVKVLDPLNDNIFNYKEYSFEKKTSYTTEEIALLTEFADKTGLLTMLKNRNIKNVVDYVIGVEVGLNTNARKNRSGATMEKIVDLSIKSFCDKNSYNYISQATSRKISESFGYEIKVDKSERSFDFAVDNGEKLYLIETNYYGTGGSKLKAVAGEFMTLYRFLKKETPQHTFIWITDGLGWKTAKKPLKEAFDEIDYILNLSMLEKGVLESIISEGL